MQLDNDEIQLRGIEKAAILFLSLGEERAARMMQQLEISELQALTRAMATLGTIPAATVEAVLREFSETVAGNAGVVGNIGAAERMLQRFMGRDEVLNIIDDIKGPQMNRDVWENWSTLGDQSISDYLRSEHNQTIAAILHRTKPDIVAKVLQRIGGDRMNDIILRMVNLTSISRDIIEQIESSLQVDILAQSSRRSGPDPHQRLADVFNKMDTETFEQLSVFLDEKAPQEFGTIKQKMFTFDDLSKLSQGELQLIWRRASQEGNMMTIALRGAKKDVRDAFLNAMSMRARDQLMEDMNAMGKIRARDAREAQTQIIDIVNDLVREDAIRLPTDGDQMIE